MPMSKEDNKKRTQWYHEHHFFTRCLSQDAYTFSGRYLCAECSKKQKEYKKKYGLEHKEELSLYQKQKKEKYTSIGLCVVCGTPNDTANKRCSVCSAKARECARKYRQKKTNYQPNRGSNGLCYHCNKREPVDGYRVCESCLADLRKLKHNQRPKENHPWRKLNQDDVCKIMARSSRTTGK